MLCVFNTLLRISGLSYKKELYFLNIRKFSTLFNKQISLCRHFQQNLNEICVNDAIFICKTSAYRSLSFRKEKDSYEKYLSLATSEEIVRDTYYWAGGIIVLFIGLSFISVPLYRIFCEQSSFGGLAQTAKDFQKIAKMNAVKERVIKIKFGSDTSSSMEWNFNPLQKEIYVYPGETALAFYTAKNPTEKPIIGISSYNIEPFQAAYYFNKIQCFCFEDQLLNPREDVDLPVFFYIDPDFANDPRLEKMDEINLQYIFYESSSGLRLLSQFEKEQQKLSSHKAGGIKL